jgi:hypothetical protein
MVGDPRKAATILGEELPEHGIPDFFDQIAQLLGNAGFEIHRNPLPLVYLETRMATEDINQPDNQKMFDVYLRLQAAGQTEFAMRRWYFASYNNAMVQDAEQKLDGHDPWSNLRATDDAMIAQWNDLGFDVRPLGDFHPFVQLLGSVHCIQKDIVRD